MYIMKTYQTLALIGCIMGLLGTIGLYLTLTFFNITVGSLVNMTNSFPKSTTEQVQKQAQTQANYEAIKARSDQLSAGLGFSFLLYIVGIVVTFVVEKTKIIGIVLLAISVITIPITNGWTIITAALLIPGGIVAMRYKEKTDVIIK